MFEEEYLCMDIETWSPNGKPDPEMSQLRYVGFKYKDIYKILHSSQKKEIQKIINFSQYIIGHNIIDFDKVILLKHGFTFPKKQIIIDTYKISQNRLKAMLYLDLSSGDMSLRKLAERFKLKSQKGEFNFNLLEKEELLGEEYELLKTYLLGDLDTVDELYKYYYNLFYGFKELMNEEDQKRMCWLTCTSGSTAYKVICNKAGLEEKYNDEAEVKMKAFEGAFVSEPYCDFIEG